MASASAFVGVLVIVAIHTVIAAVSTRYFRVTLDTAWGAAIYTVLLVPLIYVATTLVLSGALGLGGAVFGERSTMLAVTWAFPFTLGYVIDVLWMPDPEEVELPDTA